MLFNSIDFAIFLPIFFILYWFVLNKNLKYQNLLIMAASYLFYGWWDWKFLSLILISTIIDFSAGLKLAKHDSPKIRKIILSVSVIGNLGMLGFFKYFNFFIDNFTSVFTFSGYNIAPTTLIIILPVGISFYTFQTLSYTVDIYRRKLEPTADFIAFSAFVSFFPQLVAGPIERATNLLPQFFAKRVFNYEKASDGMRQILWGLFKKIVIADSCAVYVNLIFGNSNEYNGITLLLGVILFSFQVYCDFSGYSDIAIGVSRLFGFNLMRNFAYPYFSRDIAEFWRRWHISLSTWFRDYLYIPLGESKGGVGMKIRNTFIIFTVSGFWHGADWTYAIWGFLNAVYFLPLLLMNKNRINMESAAKSRILPSMSDFFRIIFTYMLTLFGFIFFRAESVTHALEYIGGIFNKTLFSIPQVGDTLLFLLIFIFIVIEWIGREQKYAIERWSSKSLLLRWSYYYLLTFSIMTFGNFNENQFIYFQF